jgi:hypothetical protein
MIPALEADSSGYAAEATFDGMDRLRSAAIAWNAFAETGHSLVAAPDNKLRIQYVMLQYWIRKAAQS